MSGSRVRQRYRCHDCRGKFDDLTGTIFAKHHQHGRVWILCLYLMGLNLSNQQIAQELGLNKDDVHRLPVQEREGVVERKPEPNLRAWSSATKGAWWPGTKAIRMRFKKRAAEKGGAADEANAGEQRLRRRSHRSSVCSSSEARKGFECGPSSNRSPSSP